MHTRAFDKRLFTLATFAASARELFAHLDELHAAVARRRITRPFAEKIMLAVTHVNGCRYCSYAHASLALQAGVSEVELRDLLRGEFGQVPESELMALLFAQHYAEQADRYDAAAWQRLQDAYGAAAAGDILTHIRLITFANLYGNTFDAVLARLKGQPAAGSRFFDEIVVLLAGATLVPVGLLIGLIARRLKFALFRRTALQVRHD
jgi:AhpD family alkylhydroperoxidase